MKKYIGILKFDNGTRIPAKVEAKDKAEALLKIATYCTAAMRRLISKTATMRKCAISVLKTAEWNTNVSTVPKCNNARKNKNTTGKTKPFAVGAAVVVIAILLLRRKKK